MVRPSWSLNWINWNNWFSCKGWFKWFSFKVWFNYDYKGQGRIARRRGWLQIVGGWLLLILAWLLLGACNSGFNANLELAAADPVVDFGDPERGQQALADYGCGACHTVAGVPGARGMVGPSLTCVGDRAYVAGLLENRPENLIYWIMFPQEVDPGNVMPDLGVTLEDAADITAYLYTDRPLYFWYTDC